MSAQTAQARTPDDGPTQALAHGDSGMPTALVGMLLFIASEVMFFGGLFAAYFNARASFAGEHWGPPPPAHELEMLPIALPLTLVLVASSFTMQFGVWAIRRGDQLAAAAVQLRQAAARAQRAAALLPDSRPWPRGRERR